MAKMTVATTRTRTKNSARETSMSASFETEAAANFASIPETVIIVNANEALRWVNLAYRVLYCVFGAKRWRGCPSFIASSSLRWYSQFHIINNSGAAPWKQPYVWRHQRVWHVGDLLTQMREYQRWLVFKFHSHPPTYPPTHTDEY